MIVNKSSLFSWKSLLAFSLIVVSSAASVKAQPAAGANAYAQMPPLQGSQVNFGPPVKQVTDSKLIRDWFNRYDQIRRKAQLDPRSKEQANALLSKGLAIIVPGDDRKATQKLLADLVTRYGAAAEELKQLPLYPETEKLHRGYYQYFSDARSLFSDYMAVQNNLLVPDAQGNPIAKSLMPRKQHLEMLDQNNKNYDEFLRRQLGIEAYSYDGSSPKEKHHN